MYRRRDGRIFDPKLKLPPKDRADGGRTFQLYKSLIKIIPVFYYVVLYNKVQNTTNVNCKYKIYYYIYIYYPCK